jgi:hypothetical protein
MIRYFKLLFPFLLMMILAPVQGQEYVGGLLMNSILSVNGKSINRHYKQTNAFLSLPFFDDFRNAGVYPDDQKWIGSSVFVNTGFGYFPPDMGVATLDALDSVGQLYANASAGSFQADQLLSRPVRLDSVWDPNPRKRIAADSIYLSFYYQPQGYGLAPEENDSLVLAFRALTGDSLFNETTGKREPKTVWKTVWKTTGMSLEAFREKYGKDFVRVMIPIRDSSFFHQDFQFRFQNYASIANEINPLWKANDDQWNIDFVYLNAGRSLADTTYPALAFSGQPPVFLKHYLAMPYRQYRADPTNALRTDFKVYFANLDGMNHDVHYRYKVSERGGAFSYDYDGGTCPLEPFYRVGFQQCNTTCGAAQACPPVNSLFSLNYSHDTASYRMVHFISDSSWSPVLLDSMVSIQPFYNYFAYDDGTPEMAYGVAEAGSEVACQFKLNVPDTLRSVQIYFNQSPYQSTAYFNLSVWRDNNGKPGELIYQRTNVPVKAPTALNAFTSYDLDEPLLVSGTFYVGYQQLSQNLTMGFDANNDAGDKIFYHVDNQWYASQFHGALLLRPVLGNPLLSGVGVHTKPLFKTLRVYPNPAKNEIHFDAIQISQIHPAQISVYNLYGQRMFSQRLFANVLPLRMLSPGMYLIKVEQDKQLYFTKFLIRK